MSQSSPRTWARARTYPPIALSAEGRTLRHLPNIEGQYHQRGRRPTEAIEHTIVSRIHALSLTGNQSHSEGVALPTEENVLRRNSTKGRTGMG